MTCGLFHFLKMNRILYFVSSVFELVVVVVVVVVVVETCYSVKGAISAGEHAR